MIKNVYIDGVDVRAAYGVWIVKGGYNDLFSFPQAKTPSVNDWPEHDGLEVDAGVPLLEPWAVHIDFAASGAPSDMRGFIDMLSAPGYRDFYLPSLGRHFLLRLEDTVDLKTFVTMDAFRLRFIQDQPLREAPSGSPSPGRRISQSAYTIDGTRFDVYGVFVRSGRDSLLKPPGVKSQLTRRISTIDGQLYDTGHVRFADRTVTLQCCMKAAAMSRLWGCHSHFFDRLIQTREVMLAYRGRTFKCYYESCRNTKLECLSGTLCMIAFDLIIRIIDGQ